MCEDKIILIENHCSLSNVSFISEAFKTFFFLSLVFSSLIVMGLGKDYFGFSCLELLSLFFVFMSTAKFGMFSQIIS